MNKKNELIELITKLEPVEFIGLARVLCVDIINEEDKTTRDFYDILNDIIDKFNIEKKKIDDAEADWMLKQDISEKLVQFDTEQNSAFLLANSKFIMEGIRKLSEKIQFNELNVFNNILTSLIIEGKHDEDGNIVSPKEYSLEEIIYVLSKYISMGEPNVLSYKA